MDKVELDALADLLARLQSKIDAAYASKPSFGGPVTDEDCTTISLGDLRLVIDNVPAIIEQREALERQSDNMAFILDHVSLPEHLYCKFQAELAEDRAALNPTGEA